MCEGVDSRIDTLLHQKRGEVREREREERTQVASLTERAEGLGSSRACPSFHS